MKVGPKSSLRPFLHQALQLIHSGLADKFSYHTDSYLVLCLLERGGGENY